MIIAQSLDLEVAFKHPITSVPLAIAQPDGTLRQVTTKTLQRLGEGGGTNRPAAICMLLISKTPCPFVLKLSDFS